MTGQASAWAKLTWLPRAARIARGGEGQAETGAALLDQGDEQVAQRLPLGEQRGGIDAVEQVEARLQRGQAEDRRGAAQEALDPLARRIVVAEVERRGVAHPAGQRRAQRRPDAARRRNRKAGRAGAAVEVFVAAADREIGVAGVEVDRDRPDAVAEVPEHQRALRLRRGGDRGHVEPRGGLVVDVGQHHDRGVGVDRGGDAVAVDGADLDAGEGRGDALRQVEVGREIAGFGQDDVAAGLRLQRGDQQLVQVHRGRIRDQHLVRLRADQRGELGADAGRGVDPAGGVPAADQALAPFLLDRRRDPLRGGLGQGAERIAVEVDHALGQREPVAERRERVGGVQRQRFAVASVTSAVRTLSSSGKNCCSITLAR